MSTGTTNGNEPTRLTVNLVITLPNEPCNLGKPGDEIIIWSRQWQTYTPLFMEEIIDEALQSGCLRIGKEVHELRDYTPEFAVDLFSEEDVRPSLHLSYRTIQLMAKSGASFDFDPYV